MLARLHPGWKIVLIERTKKKARYLEEAVRTLELENVRVVDKNAGEAEIAKLDLIVARAVGPLAKVTKVAAPLLKRKGLLVHYKGGGLTEDEIADGYKACEGLGIQQAEPLAYDVPPKGAKRTLVISRSTGRKRDGPYRRY